MLGQHALPHRVPRLQGLAVPGPRGVVDVLQRALLRAAARGRVLPPHGLVGLRRRPARRATRFPDRPDRIVSGGPLVQRRAHSHRQLRRLRLPECHGLVCACRCPGGLSRPRRLAVHDALRRRHPRSLPAPRDYDRRLGNALRAGAPRPRTRRRARLSHRKRHELLDGLDAPHRAPPRGVARDRGHRDLLPRHRRQDQLCFRSPVSRVRLRLRRARH